MNRIRRWIVLYKHEYWFKYVVMLAVLIIIAFAVNQYCKYKDKPEVAHKTETAEETVPHAAKKKQDRNKKTEKEPVYTIHIGAGHIIMLTGLTIAYGVVKYKKENNKLKEKEEL